MMAFLKNVNSGMVGLALSLILAAAMLPTIPQGAQADAFPTKPIQNIVAWAPGGSSDMSQRLVANHIAKYLGQPMVIVNKPGGAAVPGTTEIARSKNDGYTIGMNWYASFVLRPYVLKVPYKIEDYIFMLGMVRQRNVVAVRSDSPYKTLQDLDDSQRHELVEQIKFKLTRGEKRFDPQIIFSLMEDFI